MGKAQPRYIRVTTVLIVIALLFIAYFIISGNIDRRINTMIAEENSYMMQLQELQRIGRELTLELSKAETDAFVENEARTKYGYLKPGEIRFVVTNPEVLYGDNPVPEMAPAPGLEDTYGQ